MHTVFAEEATAPDGAFLGAGRDSRTSGARDSRTSKAGQDSRASGVDLASFVRGKQVFFTIDLDGLDPSIMPAVGTPEPGGLSWQRMLEICRVIAKEAAAVPVFDVVELAPIPGLIAPDFLAAKLIYKIMSYILS